MIRDDILNALKEKKCFIGYSQLCRYLNGKGKIRYGCNAGYLPGKTNGKNKLNSCKILCPNSKIYHSKIRYWCLKLEKQDLISLKKIKYKDFKNPNSETKPHKTHDIFILITLKNSSPGNLDF